MYDEDNKLVKSFWGKEIMWRESYRIGIDLIDQQHKELFRATDTLVRAIEANADKPNHRFFKGLYGPAFS